jgi:hypothetical protein
MSAISLNLPVIEKGTTFRYTFFWKDSAGNPINMSGCTARMQIRKTIAAAVPIQDLTIANGGITITPSAGRIDLLISATDTASYVDSYAVYDLIVTMALGDKIPFAEGNVIIRASVTHD